MKRSAQPVLAAVVVFLSGCIDWSNAEQSWCNDAILQNRHDICGIPDTSTAGDAPGIHSAARFGGEGLDAVTAMAALASGVFLGGSFDASLRLGQELEPIGGADAYLAKLDTEGAVATSVSFGGEGKDGVVALVAGPSDSLLVASTFQNQSSLPGGGNVSSLGETDSLLLALDGNLQPLASVTFGAEAGSRVTVQDLDYADGQVVVAGTLHGHMNLGGTRLGAGGPAAFVAVFDAQLQPLWQAVTEGCTDAFGDSAALGENGEVFFTLRVNAGAPFGPGCTLLDQTLPAWEDETRPWFDVLVRIDQGGDSGPFIPSVWKKIYGNSVRNPYQQAAGNPPVLSAKPGYEAPNAVAVAGGELIFLRHTPDFTSSRRPGADVAFLNPSNALPTRGSQVLGRSTSSQGQGQDMRARLQVDREGLVWVYGEFRGDRMLLDDLTNGPFVSAHNGFVRVFNNADPSREWARVFVGKTPTLGAAVSGLAVDASRRVWVAGTFEGSTVASGNWLDAQASDGFLFITQPQP